MLLTEDAFCKIIQETWSSILGFEIEFPAPESSPDAEDYHVCVGVSGAWNGEVRLNCPPDLARLVAAAFFQINAETAGKDQILDALSEIIHIIGGNLKALLPQPATLSLPSVRNLASSLNSRDPNEQIWCISLRSAGYVFEVSLFGEVPSGSFDAQSPIQNSDKESIERQASSLNRPHA